MGKSVIILHNRNNRQPFFCLMRNKQFSAYSGQNERITGLIVSATKKIIWTSKAGEQMDRMLLQ